MYSLALIFRIKFFGKFKCRSYECRSYKLPLVPPIPSSFLLTFSSQLHVSFSSVFFHNPWSTISGIHVHKGVGPAPRWWATYETPHYWRRLAFPCSTAIAWQTLITYGRVWFTLFMVESWLPRPCADHLILMCSRSSMSLNFLCHIDFIHLYLKFH